MRFLSFRKILQEANSSDLPPKKYKKFKTYKKSDRQKTKKEIRKGF